MEEVTPINRERHGPRQRQDAGRVARAWRWFSGRTIRRAERYRDLEWSAIVRHGGAALALILASRLFPAEGFAPFALIAGAVWAAYLARIALIKWVDKAIRHHRARRRD